MRHSLHRAKGLTTHGAWIAGDMVGNENNLTVCSWNNSVSKLGKSIDRAE
jgi:hypothetical protein